MIAGFVVCAKVGKVYINEIVDKHAVFRLRANRKCWLFRFKSCRFIYVGNRR